MRTNFTILGLMTGSMLLYLWLCTESDNQSQHPGLFQESSAMMLDQHSKPDPFTRADSIIAYAETFLGTGYLYGSSNRKGFDCSGFTHFIYNEFDITIPRSSKYQAGAGVPVPYSEARKGDLIIFTGTNAQVRQPGHVGIVVSRTDTQLTFIHASSSQKESGVKISEVEGTGYKDRFLEVRRVIE
ncbi:MAG: C40 family peptidase [Bacteroidia bacterium]